MFDTVIVGARCAGSALALMLARQGQKVLMVDRAVFPSDTLSGHYIHPAGVSWLSRWGVLDRLAATDTPPQSTVTVDFGPVVLTGQPTPAPDGTAVGYGPRRWLFDELLATAACDAGALLWQGVTVKAPLVEDGRVVGVEAVTGTGTGVTARAKLVVGADGKRSRLAARLGAAIEHHHPARTCAFYAYWSGFDIPHIRILVRGGQAIVVMPTSHGQTLIAVIWPAGEFHAVRGDIEAAYLKALAQIPLIADRLWPARRETRFAGTADLEGFLRRSHGPGWALVGDAGCHLDPITAQGMTNAFLHAELLAEAIADGFAAGAAIDDALAGYQRRRDAAVLPMFGLTADMARMQSPTPDMAALIGALQDDPTATADFLGVLSGTVRVEDFYAPANLARLTGCRQAA